MHGTIGGQRGGLLRLLFTAASVAGIAAATVVGGGAAHAQPVVAGSGTVISVDDDLDGVVDRTIQVGNSPFVVMGDWDGDGVESPATRDGALYRVYDDELRLQIAFGLGRPTDVPVVGDWNGDGVDTLGVRRGSEFFLKDTLGSGPVDARFTFGRSTDEALVGDWNGDGRDGIGVRRANEFILRDAAGPGAADARFVYGRSSDRALVGDWDGDGVDGVGVARDAEVILRNMPSRGAADGRIAYGFPGSTVLAADFDGDGADGIAARRACEACEEVAQLVELVNDARGDRGLPALQEDSGLTALAQGWSASMAEDATMSHNPSFGPSSRNMGFVGWAENVARQGSSSAEQVFSVWMGSSAHRANILNATMTSIGVGVARGDDGRWYWTQNFGRR